MDYVNFPKPGSPMVDEMDWDWVCETGLAGGDNDIQLDGSTPLTRKEGGMKFFNVYGIYDQSVKLNDVVRGSGVEYYFVPLNTDWASQDLNEEGRYALKLRQVPCYSSTGMSVEISRVSREFNIHYISMYEPHEADTTMGPLSNDEVLNWFTTKQSKPEKVIEEVLESYGMQQEAARLDAAPPVGEPALLKMMAPVYFHCTHPKDGTPSVQRRWVKAVWYGYETCIADTDPYYFGDLFYDTDWAIDRAHEEWWSICNYQLIPFIRDLELDAEEAKAVFEERDIIHGDVTISRQEILENLFTLVAEKLDVCNPDFEEDAENCFTAGAEELLDYMCDIVAEGGDLGDHTDRDLYNGCEIDAWDCYNAFISLNEDIEDLRERLYSVGAGADLHQGNVAYWNGDLVCIDFGACSST